MALRDCIRSAQEQGAITKEEADDILRRYDAHVAARKAAGAPNPNREARLALADQFDTEGARMKALAQMGEDKRAEITEHLHAYRDPHGKPDVYEAAMRLLEHYGFAGASSVVGRTKAIVAITHGEIADVLRQFERNFYTGMRHQAVATRDLVYELLGHATDSKQAKAFAGAIGAQFDKLRDRFNAAGGDIGKIEGGYIPQFHEPVALMKAGFEKWRDDIRPRLAPEKMRDPLTEAPMTPERLDEALRPVFDQITTEGWATRAPTTSPVAGRGAVANQRQDHRFLAFKSAEDWLWYDQHYGHGDPIKAIFGHINGMARDIAAMEVLGPNPSATVEWLKQVMLSEHGKWIAGKDSLFQPSGMTTFGERDAGRDAAKKIEDLWYWVRGRETVSQGVADFYGNIRNVLTSVQLGSAVVTAAATDPAIMRMATRQLGMGEAAVFGQNAKVYLDTVSHYFEQLPILKSVSFVLDHLTGAPREQAVRSGMIVDEFLHILGDEARYAGALSGSAWSRWLADRTVTLTGLEPITKARRAVFQLELQGFVADNAKLAFDALPAPLRGKLAGYGFDAAQWDALRAVAPHQLGRGSADILRPSDVGLVDRALAERYVEMINGELERAVPTGTMRSKAFLIGARPKGQHGAELAEGFLQYKSFGLSMMTLQAEAIAQETATLGRAAGASYAAQLLILSTVGGALGLQIKSIIQGRDPQNMKDPKFWGAAMASGGGMGIYGDFLFADTNRYGYSFGEQVAGPTASLASDILKFTSGNAMELLQRKDTNIGHEAVTLAGRYTPMLSSAWYARLAYKRELLDQLDYMVDPHAHRRWREEERKAMRERGQGYWWQPGESAPRRAPDLSTAIGQ